MNFRGIPHFTYGMHFRSKGKGPEGNQPAPRQAGRPYLNKPGMPERGKRDGEKEWKEVEKRKKKERRGKETLVPLT